MTLGERTSKTLMPLQLLRAVAAIGVMVFHYSQQVQKVIPESPVFPLGAAGVDLFFVISGFVMVYSSRKMFGQPGARWLFLARRVARIVPLYWIFSAVLLGYIMVNYHNFAAADLTWQAALGSFLFIPTARPDGSFFPVLAVGWTLNLEMMFYVAFAASITLKRSAAIMCCAALICVIVITGPMIGGTVMRFWSNPMTLEFVLGMGFGWLFLARQIRRGIARGLAIWAGAVGLLLVAQLFGFPAIQGSLVAAITAGLLVMGATIFPSLPQSRFWQIAALLGDASYAIYLTHTLVSPMRHTHLATTHPVVVAIIESVMVIAGSVAIHLWVERPITKWLRLKIERRAPPKLSESAIVLSA